MATYRSTIAFAALAIAALALGGASAADGTKSPATSARQRPPGEGVICAMGIYNAMAEVGRRCVPGQDREFQAELSQTIRQIDEYVLRNSNLTPADLMLFKREQALLGAPEAELCQGDPIMMYRHMSSAGAESLREQTRLLLEHPGTPTWGDCL